MGLLLTPAQQTAQQSFRAFSRQEIAPRAGQFDRDQRLPPELLAQLGARGYLGGLVSQAVGGTGLDLVTFGLLNEELGWACSSVRSLLTVHGMVCQALARWGTPDQQRRWLPRLAIGEKLGAFALTEPNVGSDAKAIETTAEPVGTGFALTGKKRWITFGQIADVYLLFASVRGKPAAFLVERDAPGLIVRPIKDVLGTRGSMLAELELTSCRVAQDALVGAPGFGISAIAASALDIGRYSVAWGCVGLAQACLDACLEYSSARTQFGSPLKDHQLIKQMLTGMVVQTRAARLLCLAAGLSKDAGDPGTVMDTFVAKYFASTAAMRIAADAVQLHGANGCDAGHPVERMFRDAKVMEIIEGSTQIQQVAIADFALRER